MTEPPLTLTAEQRADLDRYFAAIASAGARTLSNASQARRVLAAATPAADGAAPSATPSSTLYPTPAPTEG